MTLQISRFFLLSVCLVIASFSWSSVFNNTPRVAALLVALVVVISGTDWYKKSYLLIVVFGVFAWVGYALISAFYSIDPLGSVFKIAEVVLLLFIIFIGLAAAPPSFHYIENFISLSFTLMGFTVLIYSAVYKGTLVELSSAVPAINANTVGTISGAALLLFLSQKRVLLTLLAIFFLYWSYSASAIVSVAIASLVFLYLAKVHTRFGFLARKFLLGVYFLLLIYFGLFVFDLMFIQREFLLSGRVVLWEQAVEHLSLLTGVYYGVGLGNVDLYLEQAIGRKVTVHNAYLELYLALGSLAFAIFVLYILFFSVVLLSNLNKLQSYYFTITIFLMIKAFTTSNIIYISFDLTLLLMISFAVLNRQKLRIYR